MVVVSMGGRNTQLEPNLHKKQRLKPLARVDQPEHCPAQVLTEYSQTEGILLGKHYRINVLDGVASTV
jgi:hypothetical protein